MKGTRKIICLLLLLATISSQPTAFARQADGVSDLWLIRARLLTDELLKDSDVLGRYDRALLLARLGKTWQQSDGERAKDWIEKALQSVESASDKEDATEHSQRLNAARSLLVILGAQDKSLSARLNKVINATTEAATLADNGENAKAKAEAGLAVLDNDPQRALQFGLASLRAGGSYKLASLIWRLRKRDVNLSDTLFVEVIAAARASNFDPDLLNILPVVAFEGPSPSDKLRGSFLSALAEGLLRPPGSAEEQSAICKLAPTAAPLLPEFQRLLPQQAAMVSAQITRCQPSLAPDARKDVNDALQEQPLDTVDDLLTAAGKASDPERRITYLNRAAYKAFGEKKYERAISILDGFSSEDREAANKTLGGLWDSWRSDFASAAAVAHVRRNDRLAMYQVISDTPAHLRALVQISVAAELVEKDKPVVMQLLGEARSALAKADSPRNFGAYLKLVRLYTSLAQPDALSVLGDAVKLMNQSERSGQNIGDDAETQISLLSNDVLLSHYALPVTLLEVDDAGTMQAIAAVDSTARRAAMRLNLLKASLERHRAAAPKPLTRNQKGQNDATH